MKLWNREKCGGGGCGGYVLVACACVKRHVNQQKIQLPQIILIFKRWSQFYFATLLGNDINVGRGTILIAIVSSLTKKIKEQRHFHSFANEKDTQHEIACGIVSLTDYSCGCGEWC